MYGDGGARTWCGHPTETNSYCGGEKIRPLSYSEARQWAEDKLDADNYMQLFEVAEDDSLVTMTISVTVDVAAKIEQQAKENGISVSALISQKF